MYFEDTKDDRLDFNYDRLRLSIITNWVLKLKLFCNSVEIASKPCGWLASLAPLAVKVLLNTTQKAKCHSKTVCHLQSGVGHLQSEVGHLKK